MQKAARLGGFFVGGSGLLVLSDWRHVHHVTGQCETLKHGSGKDVRALKLSNAATFHFDWASCDVGTVLASVACAVVDCWAGGGGGNCVHILSVFKYDVKVRLFSVKSSIIFISTQKNHQKLSTRNDNRPNFLYSA